MNGAPAQRGARTAADDVRAAPTTQHRPDDVPWGGVANPNRVRVDADGRPARYQG